MKSNHHDPILRTKLYKPTVKDHYIIRKDIIDNLEKNRRNPLTLVVAATGYGKSVTISEWLDRSRAKYCWISIDDEFNDLRTFFFYLIHAIQDVFPDALAKMHDLLHAGEMPPYRVLINFLINGLDELDQAFIIVLDDYHGIHNNQIHEIINAILKHPPAKLHLVIISRCDLPLDLSVLHSFGEINELRMAALSFTQKEIISLAENILNTPISEKAAALLLQKTEGWIVGLRMALVNISESKDIEKNIEELNVDQQHFRQYLVKEVVQQQPEQVRNLLLTASLSDRFSREFLEAVLGKEYETTGYPIKDLFQQLISSTFFIIPLDEKGQWYRFHHFFLDFLSKQFEKEHTREEILAYHKKASLFFEHNQLLEKAIEHAAIIEDTDRIVQLFERHKHHLLDTDQFSRLRKWLQLVPAETVEQQPQLLLIRAFLQETTADLSAMQQDLALAESLLSAMPANTGQSNRLWGEFHAINAGISYLTGNSENTLVHSKKALKLLPDRAYIRDYALAYRCFALQASGKMEKAIDLPKKDLKELSPEQHVERVRLLVMKSILYTVDGNLPEIIKVALQYKPISLEKRLHVSFAYAVNFIAAVYYLRNDLEKVNHIVGEIQEYRYAGRPFTVLNCLFIKAFAMQAERDIEALEGAVREIRAYAADYNNDKYWQLVYAFEVELALRQDNIMQARELSKKINFEFYPPFFYFFFPRLTYIKLLMFSGERAKMIEATTRLEQLIHLGRLTHKKNLLLQALPLQALFYMNSGDEKSAMETLCEALILAEPGGHIRNFLDLGKPMQTMIKELYRQRPDDVYLAEIDNAFKQEQILLHKMTSKEIDALPASPVTEIERITGREINLLKLVAEGYQNKEIAEKLYVSPDTIKKSLYRLYQKLDVNNRTGAITKAVKLGLIKPLNEMD